MVDIHGRLAIVNPRFTIRNSFKKISNLQPCKLSDCRKYESYSYIKLFTLFWTIYGNIIFLQTVVANYLSHILGNGQWRFLEIY